MSASEVSTTAGVATPTAHHPQSRNDQTAAAAAAAADPAVFGTVVDTRTTAEHPTASTAADSCHEQRESLAQ